MATSGAGFGASGFLQGFAQSYNAARVRGLAMELDQRHNMASTLSQLYQNARPEAQADIAQRILKIYSTPPGKKLDRSIGDVSTLGRAAAQQNMGAAAQAGGTNAAAGQEAAFGPGAAPSSVPAPPGQAPQMGPTPPPGGISSAVSAPRIPPPPDLSQPSAGYSPILSPEERNAQAAAAIRATEGAKVNTEIEARTRIADSIPGLTPEQRANVISGHMLIPTGRGQVKTVVGPDGQPMSAVFDPIAKQFTDLQGNVMPPNVVEWKLGGGGFWGRTTPQMAQAGVPPNPLDRGKYPGGTSDPQFQADVQDYGKRINAITLANQEAVAKTRSESLAYGRAKYMQVPVMHRNPETGEPEATFASALQIAGSPGDYTPLVEGDKLMMKNAVFEDINGAAKNLRTALTNNPVEFSAGQIAALTAAMDSDPSGGLLHSAIANLVQAGGKNALTPQQQAVAVAMQQAYENAYALRGVAGFGSGSDELRRAIRNTLPGPSSPKDYALRQLTAFEQQVGRLQRGIVNVPLRNVAPPGSAPKTKVPPPPSGGTVNMRAPNGQIRPVPADQVEHYKSLGATVVQ